MLFHVAKCPTCGAGLEFEKKSDIMICKFCGNKIFFKESLDGNEHKISNFIKLANNEMDLGNFQKATEYFNNVLEVDPQNPSAHFRKGLSNGRQYTLEDFKFKELIIGYKNAQKYIPENDKREFISSVTDIFYNHGLICEKTLHEKFIYGVTDKELDYFIEKSFQIISFYQEIYHINQYDTRSPKKIVEITQSLSKGVKGKGNRYDDNCNLIRDWKYELKPVLIERIKTIQNDCVKIIQKNEPEFILVSDRKEIITPAPKKEGFFNKFRF